jgi:glutamine amidotransferase
MITLIDYGGSNLRSVYKALEFVGAEVTIATQADEIARADKLILPGVGAFGAGMKAIRERYLEHAIRERAAQGVPLLGICLGMQLLFERSEEMGQHYGLGLIEGSVKRFPAGGPKIPHMGWNQIEHDGCHRLLKGVQPGAYTYFVHSYFCQPADRGMIIAQTDHGKRFGAIIARDNIFGIQFHPEKSQQVGLTILRNFVEMSQAT